MASSKREQLIDTALMLFNRDGFHATGVDKILAEAGVARMTLYNHFKSKDELILAVLRRRDEMFRNWFMRKVEAADGGAEARVVAAFDALEEWFGEKNFSGCMFINASAEYAPGDDPIHAASAEHKLLVLRYLRGLAEEAGIADPDELANEIMLLAEGAIVMAYVAGDQLAADRAKSAALKLLRVSST